MKIKLKFKDFIISPYGATLFPLLLLLISFLFPPSLYESYMEEPNYTFLNVKMFIFVLLCIFFYYIGVFISSYRPLFRFNFIKGKNKWEVSYYYFFLKTTALLIIIAELLFIFFVYQYFNKILQDNLLKIILSAKAQLLKGYLIKGIDLPFGMAGLQYLLIGVEFWLIYRFESFKNHLFKSKLDRFSIYISLSVFLFIVINILTLNRTALMSFLAGLFLLRFYFNNKIYNELLKLFIAIVVLFILISILRFGGDIEVFSNFLGYTIVNFNRLAAVLEEKLNYISAGVPNIFYLFPIPRIPLIGINFYDFESLAEVTLSAAEASGLNPNYNMSTLFSGIYQSIGIFTPIYFTILGFIGRRLYISFKDGRTFGIILYPLFYASLVLSIDEVNIFILFLPYCIYAYIFIIIYENFIKIIYKIKSLGVYNYEK
jgi:hypothetical protein